MSRLGPKMHNSQVLQGSVSKGLQRYPTGSKDNPFIKCHHKAGVLRVTAIPTSLYLRLLFIAVFPDSIAVHLPPQRVSQSVASTVEKTRPRCIPLVISFLTDFELFCIGCRDAKSFQNIGPTFVSIRVYSCLIVSIRVYFWGVSIFRVYF